MLSCCFRSTTCFSLPFLLVPRAIQGGEVVEPSSHKQMEDMRFTKVGLVQIRESLFFLLVSIHMIHIYVILASMARVSRARAITKSLLYE